MRVIPSLTPLATSDEWRKDTSMLLCRDRFVANGFAGDMAGRQGIIFVTLGYARGPRGDQRAF